MISVIICTYNREKYIYNVLRSLAENDYPCDGYEIVLVNNNSSDATEPECRRFQSDYPDIRFRYCEESKQGLSYARNCGIRYASGDLLVYVDDDATVNATYLQAYADLFRRRSDVMAAGGPILPRYETSEPDWMSHYTRQLVTGRLYLGDRERPFPKGAFPGGGNVCYRKEVFERLGLFNVDLGRKGRTLIGAEEKDLFDRMTRSGMSFHYLPQAILYHIIPEEKLSRDYFNRLTLGVGRSERLRTRNVSKGKYIRRLLAEGVKWCATLLLSLFFFIRMQPQKSLKLLIFRKNVSLGLLGR